MDKKLYTESYISDIADAIRAKTGGSDTYKPSEMAPAIAGLSGGSFIDPVFFQYSWYLDGKRIAKYQDNACSMVLRTPSFSNLTIDTRKSHRIGVAVKMTSRADFAAIVAGDAPDRYYSYLPGIEFQSGGTVGFGVPGGGSWRTWIALSSYAANQWTYAEYQYDASLSKVTCRITHDFETWVEGSYSGTPYGYSARDNHPFAIGGWANHTGGKPYIDLANTFIESEGNIVWGHSLGAFPDES